jgi:enoyl-CoA hydratase/carnithine racemase
MNGFETIRYEIEEGIATITLNRPDRLNAINPPMMHELLSVLDRTDRDDEVRAVVFTGSGRAFCAGADISSGAASFDYTKRDPETRDDALVNGVYRDGGGRVALRIFNSLKPIIAAINGAAVGAGATIPLAMDIRLASTSARFGYVFARRGLVPESAASWFLPRVVGVSTALEWCISGRMVEANEACARGLVRSIHEPDSLLQTAQALAREWVANSASVSVALTRQMIWRMLGTAHPMSAHQLDSRLIQSLGWGVDAREGVQAFLERRTPNFSGRVSADMPDSFPWWETEQFE